MEGNLVQKVHACYLAFPFPINNSVNWLKPLTEVHLREPLFISRAGVNSMKEENIWVTRDALNCALHIQVLICLSPDFCAPGSSTSERLNQILTPPNSHLQV